MEVKFANDKIKTVCTSIKAAKKKYDLQVAMSLHSVVNLLISAKNLTDIKKYKKYRLHPLLNKYKVDRRGQLSITLADGPFCLIICPVENGLGKIVTKFM